MNDNPDSSRPVAKRTVIDFWFSFFEEREVSVREIELLLPTHRNNWLRPQVELKLRQLNSNDPVHRELHALVRVAMDLLAAVDQGSYVPGPDWEQVRPRLKRALAYFVNGKDAIPDHLPTGFDDDHREFTDLAQRTESLFAHFEAFRNHRP